MSTRRWAVVSFVVAGAVVVTQPLLGSPTTTSVSLAPHGDAVDGTSGQPMPLTPTSLLVQAEGADGAAGTSDDVTVLVTGLGTAPVATAIATPHAATYSSRIERLSATRAAMVSSGDDGNFGTSDDTLLVLDRLGSENVVIPVVLGGLGDNQQFTPERLSSQRVVVPSLGTDLTANTADDEVVVVSLTTDPPVVQRLAAPFQRNGGRTRMMALSPGAFLIASDGPNKKSSDADDIVYLFRADGDVFTRTDLAAPGLNRRAPGRSVRLSTRYGLVVSAGPDYLDSTADDKVLLLDAEEGTVTPIDVPFAKNSAAAQPCVLATDLAVIGTRGPDALDGTADDAVAILSGLGTEDAAVSFVTVGATGDHNACRPAALDSATFALVTYGSDRLAGTADDEITIVSEIGGTPIVQHVVVGALANGTTSTVTPTSAGALLVAGGGTDNVIGTPDDAVVALTGIGGKLSIFRLPIGGALDSIDAFRFVPQVLGGGRAAMLSSGLDDDLGAGGDDAVRIFDGLGAGPSLDVRKLDVRYARPKFGRSARVTVTATLRLEDADALTTNDLTISVGNASQTLPAGSLVSLREGRTLHYGDAAGALGIIREFSFDAVKGSLRLVVRGADEDFATTAPSYVPVGIDIGGTLVPQSVSAKPSRNGFVFRKKNAQR